MKILIYEYVSGGGYAGQSIPQSVLCEGFAMLRCIAADFKAAGYEVTVFLDARISKFNPPIEADCTIPILYPNEAERFLKIVGQTNDSIYIIAPESGKTLQSLVEQAQETGKKVLNCESEAISKVADKATLAEFLQKSGFPTPKTVKLYTTDSSKGIEQAIQRELDYPLLFKPIDGAGCSGISVIIDDSKIQNAVHKIKAESKNPCFIAQEIVDGEAASVSLLCTGKKAVALSLNKQTLKLKAPEETSNYAGGCVLFEHPCKLKAFALAKKAVESIPGLKGYIGVDLVLSDDTAYIVDVNPRVTTSYVGLRRIVDCNIAQEIVNSVFYQKLPKVKTHGVCCISKIETPKLKARAVESVSKLAAVVSPPFPLENEALSFTLIIGEGKTLVEAQGQLEEAKKHLSSIIS